MNAPAGTDANAAHVDLVARRVSTIKIVRNGGPSDQAGGCEKLTAIGWIHGGRFIATRPSDGHKERASRSFACPVGLRKFTRFSLSFAPALS